MIRYLGLQLVGLMPLVDTMAFRISNLVGMNDENISSDQVLAVRPDGACNSGIILFYQRVVPTELDSCH
ncbi:MAG: hypothetical protein IPP77_06195 [Bacteroidetes bacterium]|nr:hypothetical protein [Bacteroidota bacterium]